MHRKNTHNYNVNKKTQQKNPSFLKGNKLNQKITRKNNKQLENKTPANQRVNPERALRRRRPQRQRLQRQNQDVINTLLTFIKKHRYPIIALSIVMLILGGVVIMAIESEKESEKTKEEKKGNNNPRTPSRSPLPFFAEGARVSHDYPPEGHEYQIVNDDSQQKIEEICTNSKLYQPSNRPSSQNKGSVFTTKSGKIVPTQCLENLENQSCKKALTQHHTFLKSSQAYKLDRWLTAKRQSVGIEIKKWQESVSSKIEKLTKGLTPTQVKIFDAELGVLNNLYVNYYTSHSKFPPYSGEGPEPGNCGEFYAQGLFKLLSEQPELLVHGIYVKYDSDLINDHGYLEINNTNIQEDNHKIMGNKNIAHYLKKIQGIRRKICDLWNGYYGTGEDNGLYQSNKNSGEDIKRSFLGVNRLSLNWENIAKLPQKTIDFFTKEYKKMGLSVPTIPSKEKSTAPVYK